MNSECALRDSDILLKENEVAAILQLNIQTIRNWRVKGLGPTFIRCGSAVRYDYADVREFIQKNL